MPSPELLAEGKVCAPARRCCRGCRGCWGCRGCRGCWGCRTLQQAPGMPVRLYAQAVSKRIGMQHNPLGYVAEDRLLHSSMLFTARDAHSLAGFRVTRYAHAPVQHACSGQRWVAGEAAGPASGLAPGTERGRAAGGLLGEPRAEPGRAGRAAQPAAGHYGGHAHRGVRPRRRARVGAGIPPEAALGRAGRRACCMGLLEFACAHHSMWHNAARPHSRCSSAPPQTRGSGPGRAACSRGRLTSSAPAPRLLPNVQDRSTGAGRAAGGLAPRPLTRRARSSSCASATRTRPTAAT